MGVGGSRQPIRAESDAGFTLVEVIVAFGIAAHRPDGPAGAPSPPRASAEAGARNCRRTSAKTLAGTRYLDYGAVAMKTSDLDSDSSVIKSSTSPASSYGAETNIPKRCGRRATRGRQYQPSDGRVSFTAAYRSSGGAGSRRLSRASILEAWQRLRR